MIQGAQLYGEPAGIRSLVLRWWLIALVCAGAVAHGQESAPHPQITLSEAERAWVAEHPFITVALDDANPPLNFRRADGTYAGISVDYLRLITTKAGLELRLSGMSWNDALGQAMRHEVDGIMSASYKEERRVALDFTAAYCETPEAMVTRQDFPTVNGLVDFSGRRIAVVANTVRIPLLRQQTPRVELVEVANAGEGIRALAENKGRRFF